MSFAWVVALRLLREGRFQTLLIVGGIAVGVAVIVFLTAMIIGLQGSLIDNTLGSQAHIVVRPPDELARPLREGEEVAVLSRVQKPPQRLRSVDQWEALLPLLAGEAGVLAAAPTVAGPGLAIRGEAERAVAMLGIETDSYRRIVDLAGKLVAGALRLETEDILIGTDLADELGLELGDRLRIETAGGRGESFTVRGLFDLGMRDLNLRYVYLDLRQAQTLQDLPGGVSSIALRVRDIFAAKAIADRIEAQTGLLAESWMETNSELLTALRSQDISTGLIRFFVAVSVAFGIASVLVVSVVQRSKEIGILRATGTSRRQVMGIFLLQGGTLGLLGSFAGSALALGLVWLFTTLVPDFPFPIPIDLPIVLGGIVLATLTGLLSATVPALRAARLDPAEAIRG